jgi:putative FmdB family regulatory protein
MPTYEYRCPEGHEFERFQRMSDPPEAACPECGAPATRLLSGGGGFLFKGEGFYITDYRSDSYREAAKKDGASSGGDTAAPVKKEGAPSAGGEPSAPAKKDPPSSAPAPSTSPKSD